MFNAKDDPHPFDFDTIEREGLVVAYTEVFPFGERFGFLHEKVHYVVQDEYCLHPLCPCPHVGFSILRGKPFDLDAPLVGRFLRDLATHEWIHIDPFWKPRGTECAFLDAFIAAHPDADIIYAARRLQLRKVYAESKTALGDPGRVLATEVPFRRR